MEMQDEAMAVLEHAENDPNYAQRLRLALGYTTLTKNPQALAFKRECTTWLRAHTERWNDLNNGFNAIMRENFGFKSVQSLTDDQVPEARRMFERYKSQFEEVIK
jgi:hypothetical protein